MSHKYKAGDIVRVKQSHISHINFRDAIVISTATPLNACKVLVRHPPIRVHSGPPVSSGIYLVSNDCLRTKSSNLRVPNDL